MWPKCGHSTTLNNKGYKVHKEIGHVSELSSHSELRICVENIGLTRPLSHEVCKVVLSVFLPFSPIHFCGAIYNGIMCIISYSRVIGDQTSILYFYNEHKVTHEVGFSFLLFFVRA